MNRIKNFFRILVCCLVAVVFLTPDDFSAHERKSAAAENEYNINYISTAGELKAVSDYVNQNFETADKVYKLTNDIDMTEFLAPGGEGYAVWGDEGWNPIGYGMGLTGQPVFSGIFDGAGYSISGLWSSGRFTNISGAGLFGLNAGTIKNLTVRTDEEKGGISGENKVGGIAGVNSGVISDCSFYGSVGGENKVGGIAGVNSGVISDCGFYGSVGGENYIGGIAGVNAGTIIDCGFYGSVSGENYIGGIAGLNEKTIDGSQNNGDVSALAYAGGIAGKNTGEITRCQNAGGVTALDLSAGGIAGFNVKDIFECINYGLVESDGGNAGGITGHALSGNINHCANFGSVVGKTAAGGIAGTADDGINYEGTYYEGAKISNSFNAASVAGQALKSGTANANERVITNCYYDKNTSGAATDARGALSTFDMTKSSFVAFLSGGSNNWTLRSPDSFHYYPELTAFFDGNPKTEIQTLSKQAAQSLLPAYKGTPNLSTSSIIYGTPLSAITFSADAAGVFAWNEPNAILNTGNSVSAFATFTPSSEVFGELTNIEISLNIQKAAVQINVSLNGWTQGKTANSPEHHIESEVQAGNELPQIVYSYKPQNAPDSEYTQSRPLKAGKYTVRAYLPESQNYLSAQNSADFEIKADLTLLYVSIIILCSLAAVSFAIYLTNKKFRYLQKAYNVFKPKEIVKEVVKEIIIEKPVEVIKLVNSNAATLDELQKQLTRREYEVALKVLEGKSRQEIAAELFISQRTVMSHIENILSKTYCPNQRVFISKFR